MLILVFMPCKVCLIFFLIRRLTYMVAAASFARSWQMLSVGVKTQYSVSQ